MTLAASFSVIYLDAHVAVVLKPAGILSTPAHGEISLVDELRRELDRTNFSRYAPFVVHRLDRETSGLLVFARTPRAAANLAKQFAVHSVEREYAAIAAGTFSGENGTFSGEIDGKRAVTHFTLKARARGATFFVARLETGRRNQIRRHFADSGHPLLGETRFREELAVHPDWRHRRLALHAGILGFRHPAEKRHLRFEAPLPAEFEVFLDSASVP